MSEENNNGFLYFAVGGLLVAVMIIGLVFYGDGTPNNAGDLTIIEPATGQSNDTSESSMSLEFTDDGFNASSSTEEKN